MQLNPKQNLKLRNLKNGNVDRTVRAGNTVADLRCGGDGSTGYLQIEAGKVEIFAFTVHNGVFSREISMERSAREKRQDERERERVDRSTV